MDSEYDLKAMAKCKDIRIETFMGNFEDQKEKKSIVLVSHVDGISNKTRIV